MRAVKTVSAKFNGDRGGSLMEYGMAPQMVQHVGGKKPETEVFFRGYPAVEEVYDALATGRLSVVQALGIEAVGAHVLAWC